ncbi:endonuclease domain-containing protein [Sunxiuqinia indica]|uniref:endonuclease domain-containing protein n=1 Tax=Sunxiuqinia indica TaxID=2692584 RepID=UPI0013573A8D|nr:endonuclease domain-containing protein [Sunxiuqinia indica]
MVKLNNRTYLKDIRKRLRNHSTAAEATLWKTLKKKQVAGLKFRRQHAVGNYILDFYCPEIQLGIELDGEFHAGPAAEEDDRNRDSYFNSPGIEVLHFENRWVFEYPQDIVEAILEVKTKRTQQKS